MAQSSEAGTYLKTVGEFIAAAVAVIYLTGYLVVRTEITLLGIPTGVDSFDHRYLFTGGTYLVYVLQAGLAVIPTLVVLGLLLFGLSKSLGVVGRRWPRSKLLTEPRAQA